MRKSLRAAWAVLPVMLGFAIGETTVAAMHVTAPTYSDVAPQPEGRYALGVGWAAKHHPDDADACPAIDLLFQSGCIAATRY